MLIKLWKITDIYIYSKYNNIQIMVIGSEINK